MNPGEVMAQVDFVKTAMLKQSYKGKKLHNHLKGAKNLIQYNNKRVKNEGARYLYVPTAKHTKLAFSPNLVNGLETVGLGILAAPSVAGLAGRPMEDKTKELAEVGGLGVLAAHPAYELGHATVGAAKGLPNQGTGLLQRAGQGIGNLVNRARGIAPVLSKLAYTSFYQELLNS